MKTFKRLSIRTQVLLFGLFIVAIIPIIVSKVYQLSSETIINQNTQYNTELVSLLKQRISANYANVFIYDDECRVRLHRPKVSR